MSEIIPEEFGFVIEPNCKICNSPFKPDIDKMILDGIKTAVIIDFCMFVRPDTGEPRIPGSIHAIMKNITKHRKHINIDKAKIVEEAQLKSMTIYKNKVEGDITLERASTLATGRMIDKLSDAEGNLTMQDLALPIQLRQKERSVKVEESAMQLELAKFINGNKNEKVNPGGANEIESLADTIRNAERTLGEIDREIKAIAGRG